MLIKEQTKKITTYRSNVRRIWVLQQAMHLFHSKLHGEELVEKAKCSGRTTTIPSHPWLHMIHLVVYLINHFMISFETIKFFKIIRWKDIHAKNPLQQLINRLNWYLHNLNHTDTPCKDVWNQLFLSFILHLEQDSFHS